MTGRLGEGLSLNGLRVYVTDDSSNFARIHRCRGSMASLFCETYIVTIVVLSPSPFIVHDSLTVRHTEAVPALFTPQPWLLPRHLL